MNHTHSLKQIVFLFFFLISINNAHCQNKPSREAWLRDAGFGMFVHWSIDSQLGIVISHSLVGASDDYKRRYFEELPKTFNPHLFDPDRIAKIAKLAGMKYIVFTAKHHSGFCMWDTQTTSFNITNTPYEKDILEEFIRACRENDLAVGLYFSPEDFYFLNSQNELIKRMETGDRADSINRKYVSYLEEQLVELLTNYGNIDIMFFDTSDNFLMDAVKLKSWEINPDLLITRGAIKTPEQRLLGTSTNNVWEACITMGTQWQYKPTNEIYKSTSDILRLLFETRSEGGALLLNIGPNAFGELPLEQERILTEMAAWYFINNEAIDNVVPWSVSKESNIWYTATKDGNTVYAIVDNDKFWERGKREEFVLKSVKSTKNTTISVLGQSDDRVEYMPDVDATSFFEDSDVGLQVSVVRAQRIYNNHKWPNPVVIKLENIMKR